MSSHDQEFLASLRSTFKVEADEHLSTIASGLLDLEKGSSGDVRKTIETVFRAAHSLKGAARAVGYGEIERLCHWIEDAFAAWKRSPAVPDTAQLDSVHRMVDSIVAALAPSPPPAPGASDPERPGPWRELAADRTPQKPLHAGGLESIEPARAPVPVETPALHADVTVRVAVGKLEAQLFQVEEILPVKLAAAERVADLHALSLQCDRLRKAWASVESDLAAVKLNDSSPAMLRLLDFVETAQETVKSVEKEVFLATRRAERDRDIAGRLVDDLLSESKKLLLMPFTAIGVAFPKLVRQLSRDQGKDVVLSIHGDDVMIDKRILEEIKDPIIHLLRNAVDHGIETPEVRVAAGKAPQATVTIAISQLSGREVQVLVSDDGRGVDLAKVTDLAVSRGLITASDALQMSESDRLRLIFQSEVTTSSIITELSGRGLGLAIVAEKIVKLGGAVTVESQSGQGTTFRMVIPATRATFRGILVDVGGRLLIMPTTQVERVGRTALPDIRTVQGRDTISFEGRTVPLVRLGEVLELGESRSSDTTSPFLPFVVLGSGDDRVAFVVDTVLDELEVLVKPLRKPLVRVRNVAAATVLGNGSVAPILSVSDLLKSARRTRKSIMPATPASSAEVTRTILVAEDSITSRMLLKAILEAAGYHVKTAVDGMEAFTLLRSEHFDLLVSDVEMPRLNGFDLTARVRADQKLANLPVVLVTALEKREDRERGIDAGANAYIVKGSFDQSNLVDAVRRLI